MEDCCEDESGILTIIKTNNLTEENAADTQLGNKVWIVVSI